jgi:hypothetical protein
MAWSVRLHGSLDSEDVSISQQAVWLLCGMGAVVFSTGFPWDVRRLAGLVAGFGLMAWLLRGGNVPDSAAVAGFAAMVAGAKLYKPHWTTLPAFCGGVLAASLGAFVASQGVMAPAAFGLAALLPVIALLLSRGRAFAPESMVEEGVLLVLALGLGAAVGPAVIEGWQSAGSLNQAAQAANRAMPVWVIWAAGTSILIGGLWSLWRHKS